MIENFCQTIIDNYIRKNLIPQNERDYCIYGLTCWIEKSISIIVILLLGSLFNGFRGFVGSCIFCLYTKCLRRYTGGYHAKSFLRCLITSTLIFFLILLIIKYANIDIRIYFIIMLISSLFILTIAPVNNNNFNTTKLAYNFFRHKSIKWVFIEISFTLYTYLVFPIEITQYCILSFVAIALLIVMGKIQQRRLEKLYFEKMKK